MAKKAKAKSPAKKKRKKQPSLKRFSTAFPPAPYRCMPTPDPARCLKYMYNPHTGRYDIPAGEVSCASCKYF